MRTAAESGPYHRRVQEQIDLLQRRTDSFHDASQSMLLFFFLPFSAAGARADSARTDFR